MAGFSLDSEPSPYGDPRRQPADASGTENNMSKVNKSFMAAAGVLLAASAGSASAAYGYNNGYSNGYYGSSAYGAQTFRCESRNNRTTLCGVDTRGGVQLVSQESRDSCVRGRTWGTDSRGVWVAGGCRGVFAVNTGAYSNGVYSNGAYGYGNGAVYPNTAYGYQNGYPNTVYRSNSGYAAVPYGSNGYSSVGRVVRCESTGSRTRYCSMDTRYGVSLVNQRSSSPCIQGATWGVSQDRVWVSRGCRGEFAVGSMGNAYNSNSYYDRRY
jgi:hypothetical protein